MRLDNKDIALLRESFEALKPRLDEASTAFYQRLFAIAPELRALFRENLRDQGMRFMAAVGTILDHLDRPGGTDAVTTRLGQGHAALGVAPEHFLPMRAALIDTFRAMLGEGFTAEHAAAWRKAYDQIADAMIGAGRPAPPTARR